MVIIIALCAYNYNPIPDEAKLLLTVLATTCTMIAFENRPDNDISNMCFTGIFARIGKMSYSIYIVHQVVLAFYRYVIDADFSFKDYMICCALIIMLSIGSYYIIERGLAKLSNRKAVVLVSFVGAFILSSVAFWGYSRAGVVRDVPELDIYADNIHRGMHAEYNARIYDLDVDFTDDNNIKVFITGNSFARDFANILLESEYSDLLDITYAYQCSEDYIQRIKKADVVFWSEDSNLENIPEYVYDNLSDGVNIYVAGTKSFGLSNGNIYRNRNKEFYLKQTVTLPKDIENLYTEEKEIWGDIYIDMIAPVTNEDGSVKIFTSDGKFISQDCRHLTKNGAIYYSQLLDLKAYLLLKE